MLHLSEATGEFWKLIQKTELRDDISEEDCIRLEVDA
jgi:hypothetical protein